MTEIVINERGGSQSRLDERYDLLPTNAIASAARVLADGAAKYGVDNWRLIDERDHINHAIAHLFKHLADDQSEPHLDHALVRIMFAADLKATASKGIPGKVVVDLSSQPNIFD